MKTITVYGPGCARCKQTERLVRIAVEETGTDATVQKVEDFAAMAAAGVIATPAVAVDGVVRVSGRIPHLDEVKAWIAG